MVLDPKRRIERMTGVFAGRQREKNDLLSALVGALKDDRSVGATETEGIGQSDPQIQRSCGIRRIVEVTLGILVLDIDGGWSHLLHDGHNGENGLQCTSCAERMAGCGFGGADRQAFCVVTEGQLYG